MIKYKKSGEELPYELLGGQRIAETAKANYLKPYDYFEYLLTEIPKHMADQNRLFIKELLPWSPKLPESIRKPVKKCRGCEKSP